MLHLIDWKAEPARLAAENDADCREAGGSPARGPKIHFALTEPCLDDQLLRLCVEREVANFLNDQGE